MEKKDQIKVSYLKPLQNPISLELNEENSISPIKLFVQKKTMESSNLMHSFTVSENKSVKHDVQSQKGILKLDGKMNRGKTGSSKYLNTGECRVKRVCFRSNLKHKKPLAEVIGVKSFRKDTFRNTFRKTKSEELEECQTSCKCIII